MAPQELPMKLNKVTSQEYNKKTDNTVTEIIYRNVFSSTTLKSH